MQEEISYEVLLDRLVDNRISLFDYKKEVDEINNAFKELLFSSSAVIEDPKITRKYSSINERNTMEKILKRIGYKPYYASLDDKDKLTLEIYFDQDIVLAKIVDKVCDSTRVESNKAIADSIMSDTYMRVNSIISSYIKEVLLAIRKQIKEEKNNNFIHDYLYYTYLPVEMIPFSEYIINTLNSYGFLAMTECVIDRYVIKVAISDKKYSEFLEKNYSGESTLSLK